MVFCHTFNLYIQFIKLIPSGWLFIVLFHFLILDQLFLRWLQFWKSDAITTSIWCRRRIFINLNMCLFKIASRTSISRRRNLWSSWSGASRTFTSISQIKLYSNWTFIVFFLFKRTSWLNTSISADFSMIFDFWNSKSMRTLFLSKSVRWLSLLIFKFS